MVQRNKTSTFKKQEEKWTGFADEFIVGHMGEVGVRDDSWRC